MIFEQCLRSVKGEIQLNVSEALGQDTTLLYEEQWLYSALFHIELFYDGVVAHTSAPV